MVICKAGQVGVSEYLISWLLWSADVRKATGLYVFPTDTAVSDFAAARLGAAIEREVSPHLADLVVPAMGSGRRGADRVGLKRVGDRFVYFRGARVRLDGKAPQLRSVDADVLVLDEYDEMDLRAPAIARERLGHSDIAEMRSVSTPTFPEMGIHGEYMASDQRVWHVRCGTCRRWQSLDLNDLVIEWDDLNRPKAWHTDSNGKAILACRKCGGEMDRTGDGEWVPNFPERDVHGYHISRLFVAFRPLEEIIEGLRQIEASARQQVFNQALGIPYYLESAERLTSGVLNAARREYVCQPAGGPTVMGLDVGPKQLHIVIREVLDDGEWRARFIGTVAEFDDASLLMERYNVTRCVADALPETRQARAFQGYWRRGKVWLAYYDTKRTGARRTGAARWEESEGRVTLDRTRILDMTFGSFVLAAHGEPGHTLPANGHELEGYYNQMKALQRVLQPTPDGNAVAVYLHSSSRPDHFAHAEAYCRAAGLKSLRPPALPATSELLMQEDPWGSAVVEYEYA